MKLRLAGVLIDSIVDGPGLRSVIFTQGCTHNCKGCHNQHSHDLLGGYLKDIDELVLELSKVKLQRGITISGGEPFLQPQAILELILSIKKLKPNYDIWIYSGFTIEELLNTTGGNYEINLEILKNINVLVDGRFIEELKNPNLLFKGSKNQRVIYLQEYFKIQALHIV